MIAVSTEPTSRPTSAEPEPMDVEVASFTPEDVLAFVIAEATRRDPRHAHLYRTMDAGRIKDSADLVQRLLAVHRTLLGRWGRKARTGKQQHAQQIYALLASTNEANIILVEAFLETAFGVLPPSGPEL